MVWTCIKKDIIVGVGEERCRREIQRTATDMPEHQA
jgi:hypothetical protein